MVQQVIEQNIEMHQSLQVNDINMLHKNEKQAMLNQLEKKFGDDFEAKKKQIFEAEMN